MSSNEYEKEFSENFIKLLKIFDNKPNFLSKYLLENNALNKRFKDKIISSDFLNSIKKEEIDGYTSLNFKDYDDMETFFDTIINKSRKDKKRIENELNNTLKKLLSEQKYEKAAKLRDYMNIKKIKISL